MAHQIEPSLRVFPADLGSLGIELTIPESICREVLLRFGDGLELSAYGICAAVGAIPSGKCFQIDQARELLRRVVAAFLPRPVRRSLPAWNASDFYELGRAFESLHSLYGLNPALDARQFPTTTH